MSAYIIKINAYADVARWLRWLRRHLERDVKEAPGSNPNLGDVFFLNGPLLLTSTISSITVYFINIMCVGTGVGALHPHFLELLAVALPLMPDCHEIDENCSF